MVTLKKLMDLRSIAPQPTRLFDVVLALVSDILGCGTEELDEIMSQMGQA